MIGIKFIKPVQNWDEYAKAAEWANANHAMILERPDCYEVVEIPAPSFDDLKAQKLRALSASFNERVAGYVEIKYLDNVLKMQFNRSDTLAVEGLVELLEASGTSEGYLTQYDDTTIYGIPLSAIKEIKVKMLEAYAKCHAQKQQYRAAINSCTTQAELDAIQFDWEV